MEPDWLNDPAHCGQTLSGDLCGIEKQALTISKGINKVDCIKLQRSFNYMVKQLKEAPDSEWLDQGRAILKHNFANHDYCHSSWCKRKQKTAGELAQERTESGPYYRCKECDATQYKVLKTIVDKYVMLEKLKEVAHGYSTQLNESLNNTITWMAQKNKTLSGTCSLSN
jgi:hypothetical protein